MYKTIDKYLLCIVEEIGIQKVAATFEILVYPPDEASDLSAMLLTPKTWAKLKCFYTK